MLIAFSSNLQHRVQNSTLCVLCARRAHVPCLGTFVGVRGAPRGWGWGWGYPWLCEPLTVCVCVCVTVWVCGVGRLSLVCVSVCGVGRM